jgi:hypothetical protein
MVLALVGLALAGTHVPTYAEDQRYTDAPFAGLESLVVEPAQALPRIQAAASPFAATADVVNNEAAAGVDSLWFTNPTSNWADVTVGGVAIGQIGPYNTMKLDGLKRAAYAVDLRYATGFVREFVVTD